MEAQLLRLGVFRPADETVRFWSSRPETAARFRPGTEVVAQVAAIIHAGFVAADSGRWRFIPVRHAVIITVTAEVFVLSAAKLTLSRCVGAVVTLSGQHKE